MSTEEPIREIEVENTLAGENEPSLTFSFEVWHPLDHHWWQFRICRRFYGGTRRHLQLVWEFGSEVTELRAWWGEQTHCRFGRHIPQAYWRGRMAFLDASSANPTRPPDGYLCQYCSKRLTPADAATAYLDLDPDLPSPEAFRADIEHRRAERE